MYHDIKTAKDRLRPTKRRVEQNDTLLTISLMGLCAVALIIVLLV